MKQNNEIFDSKTPYRNGQKSTRLRRIFFRRVSLTKRPCWSFSTRTCNFCPWRLCCSDGCLFSLYSAKLRSRRSIQGLFSFSSSKLSSFTKLSYISHSQCIFFFFFKSLLFWLKVVVWEKKEKENETSFKKRENVFRLLCHFVRNVGAAQIVEDKAMSRALQEACQKLTDAINGIVAWQLETTTWLKRTLVVKSDLSSTAGCKFRMFFLRIKSPLLQSSSTNNKRSF